MFMLETHAYWCYDIASSSLSSYKGYKSMLNGTIDPAIKPLKMIGYEYY